MLLEDLRIEVLEANLEIVRRGLVIYTFGNASGISREQGLVAIKPSGVPFGKLIPEDIVVTDLNGKIIDGKLKPSSDVDTHLLLYRQFPTIGGVVHTHSRFATSWAQARREIPCLGTTHADYFGGTIPVTEPLTAEEINGAYELNTGWNIVKRFQGLNPLDMPAVLVASHGPFCWGRSPAEAARNAVLLEEVAALASHTTGLNPVAPPIGEALLNQHFFRKHGPGATYGQPGRDS